MNQHQRHLRVPLKARAEEYLERARDLFIFSLDRPALLREALIHARKALLLDPRNCDTLNLLGSIYADFDDPKSTTQALRYYDDAIALYPNCPDAYDGKAGVLMYSLDQPEEAESLARKALALAKRNGEPAESLEFFYDTLIGILVVRKKHAQARWLIRRALRDCPSEFMKGMVEQPLKEIAESSPSATAV